KVGSDDGAFSAVERLFLIINGPANDVPGEINPQRQGLFREDLYYRLNVICMTLPSLRERPDDIGLLINYFLRNKVHQGTGEPFRVTQKVMETFVRHDWPGNVRELENALERACVLSEDGVLKTTDLPPLLQKLAETEVNGLELKHIISLPTHEFQPVSTFPLKISSRESNGFSLSPLKNFLREQESVYLSRVLSHLGGDKEKAAELLGVSVATLYRKLSESEEQSVA
ncbi:MAG: helix-turn-helix domain-containing protein, partial [Verrucomicrobiota bacterium]